jgi:hypothetical protein
MAADHWERRKNFDYFKRVADLVRLHGRDAASIIDIGSLECPYLDWFDWIPKRVSLDLHAPYRSSTVESITADFFEWQPPQVFDVCLCLKVLEHINDATRFARKLLATGKHVIVSVPFMWPDGSSRYHVHDRIDQDRLSGWFAREPDVSIVVTDRSPTAPPSKWKRLVAYFGPDH